MGNGVKFSYGKSLLEIKRNFVSWRYTGTKLHKSNFNRTIFASQQGKKKKLILHADQKYGMFKEYIAVLKYQFFCVIQSFHSNTSSICLDSSVMNETHNSHQMHNLSMCFVNKVLAPYMKSYQIIMQENWIPQVKK